MSVFVLMAGGTGGHLFPAMALAQELRRRGHVIHLMTDRRVKSHGDSFPAREVHVVQSATPSIRNPIKFVVACVKIAAGILSAYFKLRKIQPDVVVGFGGYPVFPPFFSAWLAGVPGILHEQNAVMGRANRALAGMSKVIAASFDTTKFAEPYAEKIVVTGNPVRDRVRDAAEHFRYSAPKVGGRIDLLVFGGSQGARAISEIVPAAVAGLPEEMRKRLRIVQQCRADDLERVASVYRDLKLNVELSPFFDDLPERMIQSHLVIGRSGASTVAELGVLGCPAILIPLPGSLDADQRANAAVFEMAGAGWLLEQATLSPQSLGTRLYELFSTPELLELAAQRAKALGQPDAVMRLADLTEQVAQR